MVICTVPPLGDDGIELDTLPRGERRSGEVRTVVVVEGDGIERIPKLNKYQIIKHFRSGQLYNIMCFHVFLNVSVMLILS